MISPPPCDALGPQCREMKVTLRVAELADDAPAFRDAIGTWLMGHTERMTFGQPYERQGRVLVDTTIHVGCRYLQEKGSGRVACRAHGFAGPLEPGTRSEARPVLQHGNGSFTVMQSGQFASTRLAEARPASRSLPTLQAANPCSGAPCRTADNRRGAACCRDLTIEVVLPADELEQESLLRSRVSPYLCKTTRVDVDIVECEVISACGYLKPGSLDCSLHGLVRENGESAKPFICANWPEDDPETVYHRGCRLIPEHRRATQVS